MPVYGSLSGEDYAADRDVARLRTEWQANMLFPVLEALYADEVIRQEEREENLEGAFRPLIYHANEVIGEQGRTILPLMTELKNHVRTSIGRNQASVSSLGDAFNQLGNAPIESSDTSGIPADTTVTRGWPNNTPGCPEEGKTVVNPFWGEGIVQPDCSILYKKDGICRIEKDGQFIASYPCPDPLPPEQLPPPDVEPPEPPPVVNPDVQPCPPPPCQPVCPPAQPPIIIVGPVGPQGPPGPPGPPGRGDSGGPVVPPVQPPVQPPPKQVPDVPRVVPPERLPEPELPELLPPPVIEPEDIPRVFHGGSCVFDPSDPAICDRINDLLAYFDFVGTKFNELLDMWQRGIQLAQDWLRDEKVWRDTWFPKLPSFLADVWLLMGPGWVMLGIREGRKLVELLGKETSARLLGLYATKAIITAAESLTIGWEFGPQLTGVIQVSLPQLRAIVDYCINYVCPVDVPTLARLDAAYLAGEMTQDHYLCLSAMLGRSAGLSLKEATVQRGRLPAGERVRHWLRHRKPIEQLRAKLRQEGWIYHADQDDLIDMHRHLPSPSDLVAFAVRDVFLPSKLGADQMRAEYTEQSGLKELFAAQGVGPFSITTESGEVRKYDSGEAYWLAHYHNASPTQAFEMLHRLRPDRVSRFTLHSKDGKSVTPQPVVLDDVRSLLKEDDVNPVWRDRLAAISYIPMHRVDVRRVYVSGGFGEPLGAKGFKLEKGKPPVALGEAEKELVAVNQDRGYVEADAARLAYWSASEYDRVKLGRDAKGVQSDVCELFSLGAITSEDAMTRLRKAGIAEDVAKVLIGRCELAWKKTAVKTAVKVTRAAYMRGELSDAATRATLNTVGIVGQRVQDYLSLWAIERRGRRKEAQAETMCKWYSAGLLDRQEFRQRLLRLGWTDPDADRILRHCDIGALAKDERTKARLRVAIEEERKRNEEFKRRLREEIEPTETP